MKLQAVTHMAKLPYLQVRGSVIDRDKLSRNLSQKIIKQMEQRLVHGEMTMANFERVLLEYFPQKIALYVVKNQDDTAVAASNLLFESDGRVTGFLLSMNAQNPNGKLNISDLPMITHEIQHLTDFLFHPKIVARGQKIGINNEFEDFFEKEVYAKEMLNGKKFEKKILKDLKQNIHKLLKGKTIEEKLDYLQYIRYNIMLELKAFSSQRKISKKLFNKRFDVYEDDLSNQNKEYMFKEKLNLIKQITADLIKQERGKHKAKIKQN